VKDRLVGHLVSIKDRLTEHVFIGRAQANF